ncbi:hypothetical protein NMD92_09475 [Edwardsiella tarda]
MKPINRPAQTFWRRRVSGALRLGGLLLLCAAPAGWPPGWHVILPGDLCV